MAIVVEGSVLIFSPQCCDLFFSGLAPGWLLSPIAVEPAPFETWMKYYYCCVNRGSVGLEVVGI
jgi:hypothetical protein